MSKPLSHIPTNLIMGFLGVGKTTAILDLLMQKPENENWAVLVNEFGKVGIDGAIFSAAGATVKEIAGGCLCCAVSVPFQVSITQLLKQARPDRLLIEPTGLGHPKKVLDMLCSDLFKTVLDVRAGICLVDPETLKDSRYTSHENFIDQIALSDVLVANKMDLADTEASTIFHHWAGQSHPEKSLIAQTTQGKLDIAWLNLPRNHQRQAMYPQAHQKTNIYAADNKQQQFENKADGFQSFGYVFSTQSCFDFVQLKKLFNQLKAERIKGIFNTNQGCFIINSVDQDIQFVESLVSNNNHIEIISRQNQMQDISMALKKCLIEK